MPKSRRFEPSTDPVERQRGPRRDVFALAFEARTMGLLSAFRNTFGLKAVTLPGAGRRVSPPPINNLRQRYAIPAAFNDSAVSHPASGGSAKREIHG